MADFSTNNCHLPLIAYKCELCEFGTEERVKKFNHVCGFGDHEGAEAGLKRCHYCKAVSYSFLWRHYHEIKCNFETNISLAEQLIDDHQMINAASQNALKEGAHPKNKRNFVKKRLQCRDCGFRTTIPTLGDQCQFKTNTKKNLKFYDDNKHFHKNGKHTSLDLLRKLHQCDMCAYSTNKLDYLRRHMGKKHTPIESQKWFHCDECISKTKGLENFKNLKNRIHTSIELRSWLYCDQCAYKTYRLEILKDHKNKSHTPIELQQWFQCDECPYKSNRRKNLKDHINRKHTLIDLQAWFECDQCEFKTDTKEYLRRHKNGRHTLIVLQNSFHCDMCGYRTNTPENLKEHKNEKHIPIESQTWFACGYCEFKSKTKDCLERHQNKKHFLIEYLSQKTKST